VHRQHVDARDQRAQDAVGADAAEPQVVLPAGRPVQLLRPERADAVGYLGFTLRHAHPVPPGHHSRTTCLRLYVVAGFSRDCTRPAGLPRGCRHAMTAACMTAGGGLQWRVAGTRHSASGWGIGVPVRPGCVSYQCRCSVSMQQFRRTSSGVVAPSLGSSSLSFQANSSPWRAR